MTCTPPIDAALAYYEDQANAFFAVTVKVDVTPCPPASSPKFSSVCIFLEAGFGAGRDAPAFRRTVLPRLDVISPESLGEWDGSCSNRSRSTRETRWVGVSLTASPDQTGEQQP